jgi:3-dehydroquinate synthetase
MKLIAQDKKVQRGKLTFILLRDIGQAFIARDVDAAQVQTYLTQKLSGSA